MADGRRLLEAFGARPAGDPVDLSAAAVLGDTRGFDFLGGKEVAVARGLPGEGLEEFCRRLDLGGGAGSLDQTRDARRGNVAPTKCEEEATVHSVEPQVGKLFQQTPWRQQGCFGR